MTKGFLPKLLAFLVPAGAAVGVLIWWFSPTQQVKRAAEGVLEAVEVRLLTTGTPAERTDRFLELLTDPVTIEIEGQYRRRTMTRDEAAEAHERLQQSVTTCRITPEEAEIRFLGPDLAEYQAPMEVDVRLGQNFQRDYRFQTTLKFRKTGKNWLLSEVSGVLR